MIISKHFESFTVATRERSRECGAWLIMHVKIFRLHAQWYFSMSLNSRRFLQFHPTVMLVDYANSCFIIIRQNFLPVSVVAESVNILVLSRRQTFFQQLQTSRMRSKRSPNVIWIGEYIVVQTGIYIRDMFSRK